MVRITRLEIRDFKSIGYVLLEDIGNFNILVGKNNSGKSNILDAIQTLLSGLDSSIFHKSNLGLQLHKSVNGAASRTFKISITAEISGAEIESLLAFSNYPSEIMSKIESGDHIVTIVREHILHDSVLNYGVWGTKRMDFDSLTLIRDYVGQLIFLNKEGTPLATTLSEGSVHDSISLDLADAVFKTIKSNFLRVDLATEIEHKTSNDAYDGLRKPLVPIQVIERIRTWQKELDDKSKTALQEVFAMLTSDHTIAEWAEVIRITDSGYNPPLEAIGSGVQHLLTLAYALYLRPSILLIEEPEQHLHPKLIRQVSAALSNYCKINQIQLFITTHSTSFLNPINSNDIWITSKIDSETSCRKVGADKEITDVINELGVRISDICLSDSLFFVEGRSDRIVLEKWFEILGHPLTWPSVYIVEMDGKDERMHKARTWKPIADAFPTVRMGWLFDADLSHAEKEVFQSIIGPNNRVWCLQDGDIEDYYPLGTLKMAVTSILELSNSQKEKVRKIDRSSRVVTQIGAIVGRKENWKVKVALHYTALCKKIPKKALPVLSEIEEFLSG